MPHLYDRVFNLQELFPHFNHGAMSSGQILAWAHRLRIHPLPDKSVRWAEAEIEGHHKIIYYNPHLSEIEKIMAVAHDLGHFVLGHMDGPGNLEFSGLKSAFRARNRLERDATVFASLCLIPTRDLLRMHVSDRLEPGELYSEYRHLWSDIDGDFAYGICKERIKIFHDLLRICGGRCLKGRFCPGWRGF